MHVCESPFHEIAELRVVDVVVSPGTGACDASILLFVLHVAAGRLEQGIGINGTRAHHMTRRALVRSASRLVVSFALAPIRPARSSSLRLDRASQARKARRAEQ